jgi:uncharacterized protein (TIGR03083 family)
VSNLYEQIKGYERTEYDRLSAYLRGLDADGWVEQSYCTDWLVYQVVSHIGSGSRLGALRLRAWVGGGPPVTDVMQGVWGFFDGLAPGDMLGAYLEASAEYLTAEVETPDSAGEKEVEGFAGRRPLFAYQLGRVWELSLHAWELSLHVYVSRDRSARVSSAAVALIEARDEELIRLLAGRHSIPGTHATLQGDQAAIGALGRALR